MLRIVYIVVALAALAPAAVIAALGLIMVVHTAALPPESDRASGESLHFYAVRFGSLEVPIHPRSWAAIFAPWIGPLVRGYCFPSFHSDVITHATSTI
jgi:hypothetical protein